MRMPAHRPRNSNSAEISFCFRLNDWDFSDPESLHAQTIPKVVLRVRPVLRGKGPAAGTPAKGRDAGVKHLGVSSASDESIRQFTLSLNDLLAFGERHGVQITTRQPREAEKPMRNR